MKKTGFWKRLVALMAAFVVLFAVGCSSAPPTQQAPAKPAPAAPSAEDSIGGSDGAYPAPPPYSNGTEAEGAWPAEEPQYDGADYYGRESYIPIDEVGEQAVDSAQTMTFSLKVDTAAYANVERYLNNGELPPADAVRIEEMINYFTYEGETEYSRHPFAIRAEVAPSPFDTDKHMAFIRVKAADIEKKELPPSNLVFLIDTSGSMNSYDKLPLLQDSFAMLTDTLNENDVVSIVTYAGSAGVALNSARGSDKRAIMRAVDGLYAGGSTAGAEGILTAYEIAERNFIKGGNNRIILASDGDFNVGVNSLDGLNRLVSEKRQSGVYLSVLGFGTGNLRDDVMETLAKNGNGNYSYISSLRVAEKVLVDERAANLYTIADDVKAQVEFNPENVASWRLIGYEHSRLKNRDFENDAKDAGEIGIGADVVVLIELTLSDPARTKYTANEKSSRYSDELFEVRIRYKRPGEQESRLMTRPVTADEVGAGSADLRFASSVAAFGELLRRSGYAQGAPAREIEAVASESLGHDEMGYRQDFLRMLRYYRAIAG